MTIINIGVRAHQTDNIKSKIRLSNIFALIASTIFITIGINNVSMGETYSGYFLETLSAFCLITWIINYFGKPKVSTSYLFGLISISIFYFDSYSGISSGTYLYYFPLLLAIANIFDFKTPQDRVIMITHLAFIGVLVFVNLLSGHALFMTKTLTVTQQKSMFIFNMAFSISCLSYFIYMIVNSNLQKLSLLENLVEEESKLRILEEEKNREKEILLAELQHRLKNNLSLMSSLLKLKLENINDSNYPLAFKESIHAIQTVAQANHLQKFEDGKILVPIQSYMKEVHLYWNQLLVNHPIESEIKLKITDYYLNIKQAIPIGLIFHELISLFWFYCLNNPAHATLDIKIIVKEGSIKICVASSVQDLLKNNPTKEMIIQALIEQIDAQLYNKSESEFYIEVKNEVNLPMLESETLYKKAVG